MWLPNVLLTCLNTIILKNVSLYLAGFSDPYVQFHVLTPTEHHFSGIITHYVTMLCTALIKYNITIKLIERF